MRARWRVAAALPMLGAIPFLTAHRPGPARAEPLAIEDVHAALTRLSI